MRHNHDTHDDSAHAGEQPIGQNPPGRADAASFHGMLLVGEKTAYLSHLPMFMSPHDYQAIFEVTLTKPGSDPLALYVQDRMATGTRMYAFTPDEDFVLTDLVSLDATPPRRSSFSGTIWRGHFEGGQFEKKGSRLLSGVTAQVTNVVHFRKFDRHPQMLPDLEYVMFGTGQECFMAHLITKPPDFDQIVSAQVDGHQLTDEELQRGVRVTFPGRANAISERLKGQEQLTGQLQLAGAGGSATRTGHGPRRHRVLL